MQTAHVWKRSAGLQFILVVCVLSFGGCKAHKLTQDVPNGATCAAHPYTQLQYPDGFWYYCNDLGHAPPDSNNHNNSLCYRTGKPALEIAFPVNGPYHVNSDIPLTLNLKGLGIGDLIVKTPQGNYAQGGKIDWGDGNGAQNIDLNLATSPLHLTKQYPNAIGSTPIHVMAWAQFKYQGTNDNGASVSGSYESCVDATASLTIIN